MQTAAAAVADEIIACNYSRAGPGGEIKRIREDKGEERGIFGKAGEERETFSAPVIMRAAAPISRSISVYLYPFREIAFLPIYRFTNNLRDNVSLWSFGSFCSFVCACVGAISI